MRCCILLLGAGCATEPFSKTTLSISDITLENGFIGSQHLSSGAVNESHIADGSVLQRHLAPAAIGPPQLAENAVEGSHIATGAISDRHLLDGVVSGEHIEDGTITAADLAADVLSAKQLEKGSIGPDLIATDAITATHIASDAVGADELAAGAVGASELAPGAVAADAIAAGAIGPDQLAAGAVGAAAIATDAVGSSEIATGAVGADEIAPGSIAATHIAAGAVGSDEIAAGAVDSNELDPTITLGDTTTPGGLWIYDGSSSDPGVYAGYDTTDPAGLIETSFTNTGTVATMLGVNDSGQAMLGVNANDGTGCCDAGIYIDPDGLGTVFGDVKAFVEDHPTEPDLRLVYAAIEGPEAAAYIRGQTRLVDGMAVVELPDHFSWIASPDGMTASVTPTSATSLGLAVTELSPNLLIIEELYGGSGNYDVYYRIEAPRLGLEDFRVVRPAAELTASPRPEPSVEP